MPSFFAFLAALVPAVSRLAPVLLSFFVLSGCFSSKKDLSLDYQRATPLMSGSYTNLMTDETKNLALANNDYEFDGSIYRFFATSGDGHYILQVAPKKLGDDNYYVFARVAGDTLIVYDQTFGTEAGAAKIPAEFAGRVRSSALGYTAVDPSITAEFISSLVAQGDKNRTILVIRRKSS